MEMLKSGLWSANLQDSVKSFFVGIVATILLSINEYLQSGALPTLVELGEIAKIALVAGVSTLITKMLTNSNGDLLKKEPK